MLTCLMLACLVHAHLIELKTVTAKFRFHPGSQMDPAAMPHWTFMGRRALFVMGVALSRINRKECVSGLWLARFKMFPRRKFDSYTVWSPYVPGHGEISGCSDRTTGVVDAASDANLQVPSS